MTAALGPAEQRVLDLLSDREPHTEADLRRVVHYPREWVEALREDGYPVDEADGAFRLVTRDVPDPPAAALIVVDMLEDFVAGALANPRAEAIVPVVRRLLEHARAEGWVVVFSNDAHLPDDPELRVWGEHALAGTPGAQVVAALEPRPGPRELVSPKRAYGAFDGTALDQRLRRLGVSEVVLAGQHTHICIRHSAYGALIRGYGITVPTDAVCAFEGVDENEALEYLRTVYGARLTTVERLVAGRVPAPA